MFRFNDHAYARRLQTFHQRVGNLNRELLLDLQSSRENIDDARNFREADDFAVRNVGDVARPMNGSR